MLFVEDAPYISGEAVVSLKPTKRVVIEVIDEENAPIPLDEVHALSSKYIPAVPPAPIGFSNTGTLTLYTNLKDPITIITIKRPSLTSDGYLLVKEVKPENQDAVTISSANTSTLLVSAYEPDGSLLHRWDIEVRLPDLYLGHWVFLFPIAGKSTIHTSPMNAVINARYIPPRWYFYFESTALSLRVNPHVLVIFRR